MSSHVENEVDDELGQHDTGEKYRKLLNDEILDARKRYGDAPTNVLEDSQIGVSVWTASEKNVFFSALARLGRHDCSGIASAVGTKSELEVRGYLLLLEEGLAEVRFREPKSLLRFRAIPAAIELSEACCEELEKLGDVLSQEQRALEEKNEENRHGSFWLLDPGAAQELESCYKQESQSNPEEPITQNEQADDVTESDGPQATKPLSDNRAASDALDALPAARLLKPRAWLELSARVFMNSGDQRSSTNWQAIAEPGKEPSIYHTAFSDFHRLAVSIMQRLVQATLFQAMSRLRAASGTSKRPITRAVERGDVLAALAILGMKADAKDFWTTAPCRCGLTVYQDPPRAGSTSEGDSPLEYAEVERLLSRTDSRDDSAMDENGGLAESAHENGEPSDALSDHAEDIEEDESDIEADVLDREASRAEELRLWDILGQDPPTGAESASTGGRPPTVEGQIRTAEGDLLMHAEDTATSNVEASERGHSSPGNENEEPRSATRNSRLKDLSYEQRALAIPGSPLGSTVDTPEKWHSAQPSPQYMLPDRPRHGISEASP
ncbi:hypothetical protein H2199_007884 [Coniosporium tulheliwenetii]|uniref:Uncharacterized protein n=1 Tax=Coniosporium tulheliwenetii TaxID=3383036 RepID=A0ACC2YNE6_9PEZI|nr:hypothetical protein H2199_007884 [Cladosporium sp. JES 115]